MEVAMVINYKSNEKKHTNDIRQQQLEVLQSVVEYTPKVLKELRTLTAEFYGIKQDDSEEYLDFVLENINWELEALNGTIDMLNEYSDMINKQETNEIILNLNGALSSKVDAKIADALSNGLIPLLEQFSYVAEQLLKNA